MIFLELFLIWMFKDPNFAKNLTKFKILNSAEFMEFVFFKSASKDIKLHDWFKSDGHFGKLVDFAYQGSCIGKCLWLQLVQQACFSLSCCVLSLPLTSCQERGSGGSLENRQRIIKTI